MKKSQCGTAMTESQALAAIRIQEAMVAVGAAQRRLDDAAVSICPVVGLAPEWRRLVRLYDQVKGSWYRLEAKLISRRFDLDSGAKASLATARATPAPVAEHQ